MDRGVEFVMTSKLPPGYALSERLQRERLLPAIELIKQRLDVVGRRQRHRLPALKMERLKVYHIGCDAPLAKDLRRAARRGRGEAARLDGRRPQHPYRKRAAARLVRL